MFVMDRSGTIEPLSVSGLTQGTRRYRRRPSARKLNKQRTTETVNRVVEPAAAASGPLGEDAVPHSGERRVWQAHVAVAEWPRWQKDITEATIDRELAVGAQIRWVTHGINEPIVSTVHRVEPERLTLWGGPAMGIVGFTSGVSSLPQAAHRSKPKKAGPDRRSKPIPKSCKPRSVAAGPPRR
jgi:hypothetical protein